MPAVPAPPPQARAERMVVLDGLRGLAAICVLMGHHYAVAGHSGPFDYGRMAVDFFFMLSGFVLVPVIEGPVGVVRLMAARVLRFWPLVAVGVAIGFVVHAAVWGAVETLPWVLPALVFLPSLSATGYFPLNSPQWSLCVELIANLLHVALLRHVSSPVLILLALACWAILLTTGLEAERGALPNWAVNLLRAGYAYPIGMVLARHRGRFARLKGAPWQLAPAVLVGALILPALAGIGPRLAEPVLLLAFIPVVMLGATARPPGQAQARLAWLGAISFPLYAIHFPLIEAGRLGAERLPHGLHAIPPMLALGVSFWLADRLAKSPLAHGLRLPAALRGPRLSGPHLRA